MTIWKIEEYWQGRLESTCFCETVDAVLDHIQLLLAEADPTSTFSISEIEMTAEELEDLPEYEGG